MSLCIDIDPGLGGALAILDADGVLERVADLPITFLAPAVWKGSYELTKDKRASLHKARLLYPAAELHPAKHEGRAESIFIARYGLMQSGVRAAPMGL